MNVIKTTNLTKIYKDWRGNTTRAVDNLSLEIEKGEIFGFLGPNGAGKTTTIKMLLGLVFPTSGEFTLFGENLSVKIKKKIGYLPEDPAFPSYFTAEEALNYYADLYEMKKDEKKEKINELLELVLLDNQKTKKVSQFSKGMKQRLGLAQALLPNPELVFLDEPTSGLDPQGRKDVRDILLNLKSQEVTVFLNSHILSEVERTCDRVGILKDGVLLSLGTIDELTAKNQVEIHAEMNQRIVNLLKTKVTCIRIREDHLVVEVDSTEVIPDLAEIIVKEGGRLKALIPRKQSLEDIFLEMVK
ncbi:MAG: ABC transporter ATP-binding protein [Theionarchaea archaeon]|nr:ABC transporter ATP-binding protein [Theionarchaea archaeon]